MVSERVREAAERLTSRLRPGSSGDMTEPTQTQSQHDFDMMDDLADGMRRDGGGPEVRVSVGRSWKRAKVMGVDESSGLITVKYKSGLSTKVEQVDRSRILTEEELNRLKKHGSSISVKR